MCGRAYLIDKQMVVICMLYHVPYELNDGQVNNIVGVLTGKDPVVYWTVHVKEMSNLLAVVLRHFHKHCICKSHSSDTIKLIPHKDIKF